MTTTTLTSPESAQAKDRLEWWEWLHHLPQPLRFWLAPNATDSEDRFSEVVLRVYLGLAMVLSFTLWLTGYNFSPTNTVQVVPQFLRVGILVVSVVLTAWCIHKQNIRIASIVWMAYAILLAMLNLYESGYWHAGASTLTLQLMLLAFLVLRSSRAILMSGAAIFIGQVVVVVLLTSQGYVDPNPAPTTNNPANAFLVGQIFALGFWGLSFAVIRAEFSRRFFLYRELIDSLEQRVEKRTEELQVALAEAERANQLKSQFLASMSHELRTPLNAILNFNEMIALGMTGPVSDMQKDLLLKSLDSGKHLLNLINDVLDMSKIQADMLTLLVEDDIDLTVEIGAVLSTVEPLVERNTDIKLATDIDPDLPAVRGDKRRIRQVLLNLLSNAIKFTEEGTVTLGTKVKNNAVTFAVMDTGPGIPAAQLDVIFEPFIQTETGVRHQGGTGLGLPISRRIAEIHGGKLWAESAAGEGASFFFQLPLESPLVPTDLGTAS